MMGGILEKFTGVILYIGGSDKQSYTFLDLKSAFTFLKNTVKIPDEMIFDKHDYLPFRFGWKNNFYVLDEFDDNFRCPKCGGRLDPQQWSGIKCLECEYYFCY